MHELQHARCMPPSLPHSSGQLSSIAEVVKFPVHIRGAPHGLQAPACLQPRAFEPRKACREPPAWLAVVSRSSCKPQCRGQRQHAEAAGHITVQCCCSASWSPADPRTSRGPAPRAARLCMKQGCHGNAGPAGAAPVWGSRAPAGSWGCRAAAGPPGTGRGRAQRQSPATGASPSCRRGPLHGQAQLGWRHEPGLALGD